MNLPVVRVGNLKRVLTTLEPARFAYLVQGLLKLKPAPGGVPLGSQLLLALADWLAHLGFVSDNQAVMILKHRRREVFVYQAFLAHALENDKPVPSFTVTISDGRWVHCTPDSSWLDLTLEEEVACLPAPAATHVVCDLSVVYLRVLDRLKSSGGVKDESPPDPASRV